MKKRVLSLAMAVALTMGLAANNMCYAYWDNLTGYNTFAQISTSTKFSYNGESVTFTAEDGTELPALQASDDVFNNATYLYLPMNQVGLMTGRITTAGKDFSGYTDKSYIEGDGIALPEKNSFYPGGELDLSAATWEDVSETGVRGNRAMSGPSCLYYNGRKIKFSIFCIGGSPVNGCHYHKELYFPAFILSKIFFLDMSYDAATDTIVMTDKEDAPAPGSKVTGVTQDILMNVLGNKSVCTDRETKDRTSWSDPDSDEYIRSIAFCGLSTASFAIKVPEGSEYFHTSLYYCAASEEPATISFWNGNTMIKSCYISDGSAATAVTVPVSGISTLTIKTSAVKCGTSRSLSEMYFW